MTAPVPADQEEALREEIARFLWTARYGSLPDATWEQAGKIAADIPDGRAADARHEIWTQADALIAGPLATLRAERDQLASELREAEERVTRLHEARQSALRQMNEQRARADAAEQRGVELERGALHPALAIDVQQHRDEAYKTGWDDGYAEGHAKASALSDPRPSPAKGDDHHG